MKVLASNWKDSTSNIDEIVAQVQDKAIVVADSLERLATALEDELPKAVTEVRSAMQIISVEAMTASHTLRQGVDAFSRTAEGFEEPRRIIFGPKKSQLGPGEGSFLSGDSQ